MSDLAASEKPKSIAGKQGALSRFVSNRLALVGTAFVLAVTLVAVFAPVLAPFDPNEMMLDYPFMGPPNSTHLLGTDPIGRDVLSRLIYASQVSLFIGVASTAASVVLGCALGLVGGYRGGWIDGLIMRLGDMLMSFPRMLLIMAITSVFPRGGVMALVLVTGFLGWPSVARLVRGVVLSVKKSDYVRAAVSMGFSDRRILLSHIFPSTVAPLTVNATFAIARAMITEASLSFLGLGVQSPTASWGNMLNSTQSLTVLLNKTFLWLPPGLMIMATVLSFNFIGDGLRDALDPAGAQY